MALISFLRNPVLAKLVGVIACVAFLLPLIRMKVSIAFMVYASIAVVLAVAVRLYVLRRRKRLTPPEEAYLQDRFYEQ